MGRKIWETAKEAVEEIRIRVPQTMWVRKKVGSVASPMSQGVRG